MKTDQNSKFATNENAPREQLETDIATFLSVTITGLKVSMVAPHIIQDHCGVQHLSMRTVL